MSIADQPSATRQVLPDDELEQAIRWCESARKILKKPAIGSGKRGEMASATKKVAELLEKLQTKRAREYGIFRAQFLNIAEQAETAERQADKNGVLEASAGLSQLAKNLTKLLAQIKEVDASVAKFDDRLRDARIQLTKARNLREATLPESPVFKHLSEAESYYDLAESYRNQAASSLDVTRLVAAKNGLVSLAEQIEQARAAAKVADERAEASAKEMEQFTLAEQAANEAVKELEVLFGAEAQALRIRELLAEARGQIRKEREIWFGHREAIHTLQGVGAVLEEGRNANLELMSNRLPDFVQLQWTQTLELLESMALVAPAHEVDSLREQAARAAESGRLAADQASHDLAEIAEVILQRTSALNEEREQALVAVDELKQVLANCLKKKLGGPACLEAQRTCDRATDALLPQRRWNEAQRQASAASKELKKWLDAHREFGGEWEQKRSLLQDIIARANRGMLVPVCAVQANQLLIAAEQVLVEFRHADFQAALLAFESTVVGPEKSTLSQADEMLAARLRSLGAAVDDAEYWDEFRRSQGEVARAANDAKGALAGIVYDRKGLEPEQANLLIQSWWDRVDQTVDDWKALIDGLLGDVDRLVEERTLALARLASLAGEARLALRRSSLEELLATLPTREAEPPEPNAAIRKKIVDCLAKLKDLGVDASKELAAWNSLQNEPQADVKEFYRSIRNKLRTAQIERQALRKEFAPELYKMVLDPFVKIPCGDEYRKELERQANDISWLVVSQDPDLIAIAREDMAKLKATLDEVQRDAELHEANKKRLGALGVRIGALMELLPETQRKLYEEHIDLKVAISGVSPRDAAAKIDAFELLIAEAENKTKAREIAIEDYKKLKHDAVERLAKLRKFAAIDPSDRGDAFLTYVEARIEEASDLKAKEDGLVRAIALLERLLEELKSISEAKDKLQRLLELDAKQVNDQRLVKDMATQFDQRKSIFTGITLPRLKEVLDSSPDNVSDLVDGFDKVASAAAKIVSPYLKLLKTLPHEKKGAQPSPDMERMKGDFARAYGMLEEAERSALRMFDHVASTNVSGPTADGLLRLEDKWRRRVGVFDAAIREVVAGIREAAATEQDEDAKANAEEVAKLIDRLKGRFDASAFGASIRVLSDDLPESENELAAAKRSRLAERESALRSMRQFRDELLVNPLLRRLSDRSENPFAADAMLSAMAGLRATLKELELQFLDVT